jgi:phosphopantetheinyl transferase
VVASALEDLAPRGWPASAIEIASEPGGRPYARLAPEVGRLAGFAAGERLPVAVSISHAEGHALCAAAALGADGPRALGADLGLAEPRSLGFVETFFTAGEQRFVGEGPPEERALRANLVWCAKEAVLKALGRGLTVDTRELSCVPEPGLADPAEWPVGTAENGWRRLVATLAPSLLPGGREIRGIWRTFGGFVCALAAH